MAVDTPFLNFSVYSDYFRQKLQIWIYPSIRSVSSELQFSACVIWHTSAFSSRFPFLRKDSWQPAFHLDYVNWGFSEKQMDQLKVQIHLSGPLLGLYWTLFFLLFLKGMAVRYCSSVVDSFIHLPLLFSSSCLISWFLALGITLLLQNYNFMTVDLCYCWIFFSWIHPKKWEQMCLW